MKKRNLLITLTACLIAAMFVGCLKDKDLASEAATTPDQQETVAPFTSEVIPGQYLVVYQEGAITFNRGSARLPYAEVQSIMQEEVRATLQRNNINFAKVMFVYGSSIKGFALKDATAQEIEQLRRDEQIAYIEQDQTVSVMMGGPPGGGGGGGQTTPWGVTRVGGAIDGTNAGKAYIIDSGIDLDHPDLNVDVANSVTFLGGNSTPDDQNGHGTHVAGTVAAVDNTIGVVGVAAGATVVAVRVLDRRGSGSFSGVIAGVDYVGGVAGNNDAANMSLGGGVSTTLDNAVIAAAGGSGCNCPFVLAAGNESDDANNHSPARANGPNVYTVSAMNASDNWASFSNYGNPPVDYCAPGVSIPSLWKDGGYNTISGTSMAAPHVCGILLIGGITTDGTVKFDPDGNPDPIAHH